MNICRATAWKIFFEKIHWSGFNESSISKWVVEEFILRLFESEAQEEKCLINNSSWCLKIKINENYFF
jgi:hypothetical protein